MASRCIPAAGLVLRWGLLVSVGAAVRPRLLAPGVVLIPDVLSEEASSELLERLAVDLSWKVETDDFGTQGRPICYFGDEGCAFSFVGCYLEPRPWPGAHVLAARSKVANACKCEPEELTACLANLYLDNQGHIPYHHDEVRAHGAKKIVAVLSLGGPRQMNLRRQSDLVEVTSVDLTPGSVLLMRDDAHEHFEHELPLRRGDPRRISLTFRSIQPGFEIPPG